jgi:hypothetical protein
MNDRFDEMLKLLGESLGADLTPDKNNACAIQIKKGLVVQLQNDQSEEKLLMGCKICELPPGKFRENVLKEALKANGQSDPRVGIFAYIDPINTLFFFQRYPFDILTTGERIASLIGPFVTAAEEWKKAIESGQSSPTPPSNQIDPTAIRP